MTSSRTLIIGGGIAGPVTAMALARAGIESTIYEAYDSAADDVGAFLTLAPNGIRVLRDLDVDGVVRDAGFDTPSIRLRLNARKVLGDILMPGTVTLRRGDLYTALRKEAVRRGIQFEHGKRLIDARQDPTGVTAHFADGSTARGDMLIGADGLQSTVRTLIDANAPAPRYVPLLNTGGFASGIEPNAAPGVMDMIFGKKAFLGSTTHPNGSTWWWANVPQATQLTRGELSAITPGQWRARLLELFSGDEPRARQIIEATPDIMAPWSTFDFPTVPAWHRDRMIIIGDAAHATSPAAGQGASMALEDSVELARCLRDLPNIGQAFGAYESRRRERVEKVVAHGKRNGDNKTLGPITRLLLPVFFKLRPADDLGWLYDHEIEWSQAVSGAGRQSR
ncbi:MAG: FAD-dependent monooxygenase [Actinomycetota bacterium]|nr:FAD-dependent monooxygenase [Actinomycetota bacterium]